MYITSRPADVYGRVPACEASAATASLIFDQVSILVFKTWARTYADAILEFDGWLQRYR